MIYLTLIVVIVVLAVLVVKLNDRQIMTLTDWLMALAAALMVFAAIVHR